MHWTQGRNTTHQWYVTASGQNYRFATPSGPKHRWRGKKNSNSKQTARRGPKWNECNFSAQHYSISLPWTKTTNLYCKIIIGSLWREPQKNSGRADISNLKRATSRGNGDESHQQLFVSVLIHAWGANCTLRLTSWLCWLTLRCCSVALWQWFYLNLFRAEREPNQRSTPMLHKKAGSSEVREVPSFVPLLPLPSQDVDTWFDTTWTFGRTSSCSSFVQWCLLGWSTMIC